MGMKNGGNSFRIIKLYERKRSDGSIFFTGRLGYSNVEMVKSENEPGDAGGLFCELRAQARVMEFDAIT